MAMDGNMGNAFASGSGIDPANMKVLILSITGAAFALLFAWIATRLWRAVQDGAIKPGEMIFSALTLAGALTLVLLFLGLYS